MTHLIALSRLRWDFVCQRPQHLMSCLSRHYPVLFVEPPLRAEGPAGLIEKRRAPALEVLVPRTPLAAAFHDDQWPVLGPLLAERMRRKGITDCIAWLDTPLALPLLAWLRPRLVVYDCSDVLPARLDTLPQLRQREAALLKRASLVFTGGPSLYEAVHALHPQVHCLPSAVDAAYFAPARLDAASEEAREADRLQARLPVPRLGFFGAIDERLDLALLDALAAARPDWQLVMVGPVVGLDPAALPRRPNIHWLGRQPHARLPHLLAGWDVCLLPFAMSEATRHSCPIQALEYMAGDKPIVSTPVPDVMALYGDVVRIAHDPAQFIEACTQLLGETGRQRGERQAEMTALVFRSSWDGTAQCIHGLIEQALRESVEELPALAVA